MNQINGDVEGLAVYLAGQAGRFTWVYYDKYEVDHQTELDWTRLAIVIQEYLDANSK